MWGRCYAEWKGRQSTHLLYPWKNAVGMIEMLTRKAHHNIVLRYVWITYRTHWLALWGSSHFQTGYVIQPQWDDDEPCCRWNLATLGVGHTTDELGIGEIHDWDRFASEYWGDRTYCRWSSLRWNEPVSGRRVDEVSGNTRSTILLVIVVCFTHCTVGRKRPHHASIWKSLKRNSIPCLCRILLFIQYL